MKNILMVAYYYPPKGGAGVQRTTKFANYLSEFGYNVSVLTVREDSAGLMDESLKKEIHPNVNIYRTNIEEAQLMNKVMGMLSRNKGENSNSKSSNNNGLSVSKETAASKIKKGMVKLGKEIFMDLYNYIYVPDDKKGWIEYAVEEGRKVIKNNNIDMIYTTSAPYTSHIIGYKLAKEFNIKWVADFRDPWVCNPFVNYGTFLKKKHKNLENKVVKRADKVLSVSQPIINDFLRMYPGEPKEKFHVITNGYDEKDFEELPLELGDSNEKFTILYNGTLYGKRSPEKILKSIENLIKDNKISENKIEIKFLGQVGQDYMKIVNEYKSKYPEVIKHKDYVPHAESLKEICKSNALLLIIDEGIGSEGIFTGKIFEYIRSKKIILGIVPDGVARDLIIETNTGFNAYPSKQKEIEEIIYKAYKQFVDPNNKFEPNFEKVQEYSRENLTKKLVDVMNEIK